MMHQSSVERVCLKELKRKAATRIGLPRGCELDIDRWRYPRMMDRMQESRAKERYTLSKSRDSAAPANANANANALGLTPCRRAQPRRGSN